MGNIFEQFYFEEKITSDLRRAFTSNILKKNVVGVDVDKLKYFGKVDSKSYIYLSELLRKKYLQRKDFEKKLKQSEKEGKRKVKKDYKGESFIKGVYKGEIDDKASKIGDYKAIKDISVYEPQGGGKIVLISVENETGRLTNFIGMDRKGNDFFKTNTGLTFDTFLTRAKLREKEPRVKETGVEKMLKKDEPKEIKELGIYELNDNDANSLINRLGDGHKAFGLFSKLDYKFKGELKKEHFFNNIGSGYKYRMKEGATFYIINNEENDLSYLIFDGKNSYFLAKLKGVTDMWFGTEKPRNFDEDKIYWVKDDINNMSTIM